MEAAFSTALGTALEAYINTGTELVGNTETALGEALGSTFVAYFGGMLEEYLRENLGETLGAALGAL